MIDFLLLLTQRGTKVTTLQYMQNKYTQIYIYNLGSFSSST